MPQFAANLSMMFTEEPFLRRFGAAAEAGFRAVEYLFPYEHTSDEISSALQQHGLTQALFNAPPGRWEDGERGIASLPDRDAEFDQGLETALEYARALNCRQVHVMAGIADSADPAARQRYVERIRRAAQTAQAHGVRILIEPINPVDMPGYFLSSVGMGRQILDEIDHSNVGLQLDLYHAQITDGDLSRLIASTAPVTSHIQIAGVPDRHEPDLGEVNYAYLFERIDSAGYTGWIGCEYRPAAATAEGLDWFRPYRAQQGRSGQ
ncbi:2-oxo-tetronate isomerase [Nesterenkonia populi]|uniref:2-oxo-tetronate isomerase n=1 Tax=Nesterenkonia populi TaxID=1591087 RepID=UPI0011BE6035|nr:2-oxo-tetronate isomerase [Nesterenkonia populi]